MYESKTSGKLQPMSERERERIKKCAFALASRTFFLFLFSFCGALPRVVLYWRSLCSESVSMLDAHMPTMSLSSFASFLCSRHIKSYELQASAPSGMFHASYSLTHSLTHWPR